MRYPYSTLLSGGIINQTIGFTMGYIKVNIKKLINMIALSRDTASLDWINKKAQFFFLRLHLILNHPLTLVYYLIMIMESNHLKFEMNANRKREQKKQSKWLEYPVNFTGISKKIVKSLPPTTMIICIITIHSMLSFTWELESIHIIIAKKTFKKKEKQHVWFYNAF